MKRYDLIVAGGGFAGTAAALAAAREGLSVLLFDKSNALGGAAANCLVNPFMRNSTLINGERRQLSGGIFAKIRDALYDMRVSLRETADTDERHSKKTIFSDEHLKLILNRMAREAGIDLLFHAYLCGAERDGGRIKSVCAATKSGMIGLEADAFIDATGDGLLSALAGCDFRLGREPDSLCQPMTLCFRLSNVNVPEFTAQINEIQALYKRYQEEGKIKNPRENILWFFMPQAGVIHFNTTRVVKLDPTDPFDVTRAEIEAREQAFETYVFLKENFSCCKDCELMYTAPEIGVRESRMTEGEYTLTGDELKACCRFDDSIALGNYDIDIHNPEGSGTSHYYFPAGQFYEIPFRILVPKGVSNLLVAGRCVSVDHEAQASVRIMPIVCCLGEAAGVGAAVAHKSGCAMKDADPQKIREILKNNGALCDAGQIE